MKPSEALSQYRDTILRMTQGMGMGNVRIFGSVLYGQDTEGSDLDLLVDAPRGTTLFDLAHLQHALEAKLGIPVDLLTAGDLPPTIRATVLREARPL